MTYSIVIHPDVQEVLKKLSKKDHPFLIQTKKKITQLVENPEIGKPLYNILKGLWRVHIGNYVLIYEVKKTNNEIILLKFVHYDEAY